MVHVAARSVLLVDVQNAPGIGMLVAVEQLGIE